MRDQPWAASAAALDDVTYDDLAHDGEQLDREERAALRRVAGLSTELQDVTEVEYRQLRLERVVLAGVWTSGSVDDADNSLRELAALAETAGSTVLAGLLQRRDQPDPATYLGQAGKAAELRDVVVAEGADTVICDGGCRLGSVERSKMSSGQGHRPDRADPRHLRSARQVPGGEGPGRARSAAGTSCPGFVAGVSRCPARPVAGSPVVRHRLPRPEARQRSRLDRRRINSRIAKLKRDIATMKTGRDTKRASRKAHGVPSVVVIAGYTNAGKSSLLNRLTGAGVLVENQLFATARPTVRRGPHPRTGGCTRSRTRSDSSGPSAPARRGIPVHPGGGRRRRPGASRRRWLAPGPGGQISAVREVLADVGAGTVRELIVVNKADAAEPRSSPSSRDTRSTSWSSRAGLVTASRRWSSRSPRSCRARMLPSRFSCPTTAATCSTASTRTAMS